MLGIPRPDFPEPPAEATDAAQSTPAAVEADAPAEPATSSRRTRARVRYDSANESLLVTHRRRKALRGLAVLVLLAAAWLGYRVLTVHG